MSEIAEAAKAERDLGVAGAQTGPGGAFPEDPFPAVPEPPVRHQQIIITLYGLYARQRETALPVSVLIAMLGDLGYDAPGVRSSVSRLKAKGVLNSVRTDGVAGYAISPRALEIFTEGDERIFATEQANPGHDWVLAIFSVPESMRSKRHQLRSELQALGFGAMGSGVWIAPARVQPVAKRRLEARGLAGFVEFFHGDYATDTDMRQKVAQWWDLGELDAQLREFLDVYAGALDCWTEELGDSPDAALAAASDQTLRAAFRYYIPMLTLWRRIPYRDPGLPLDLLPEGWKGPEAQRIFLGVHRLIAPLAAAHARTLMGRQPTPAPH